MYGGYAKLVVELGRVVGHEFASEHMYKHRRIDMCT